METNILDYSNKRTCIYGIHEKYVSSVVKCLQQKNLEIEQNIPCFFYSISPEKAKKFTVEYV